MKVETDRLIIRSMQATDLESLAALWADPEVTRFMGGPRNREEVIKMLKEDLAATPEPAFDLWPVLEKVSGKIVGDCGIIDKEVDGKTEYEVVYVFARTSWGKGYATEAALALKSYAFQQLGLNRVIALIDPENTKSERVVEKIGFRHEKDTIRPHGNKMKVYALNSANCVKAGSVRI